MLERNYPKDILLDDGRDVLIRPPEAADTAGLLAFFRNLSFLERWCLDENPLGMPDIHSWIENPAGGRAFHILAWCDAEIVGHGALLFRPHGGRRHVGRIRLTMEGTSRKQGLGVWMGLDLSRRAMELGIERLWIDCVQGLEDETIQAMRKLDFSVYCTVRDGCRGPDGRSFDCLILTKTLHTDWSDF